MFVEELSTEKKKLEKKYSGLLGDMNKFTNKIEKSGARELPQD
jgi:hypothetical protein